MFRRSSFFNKQACRLITLRVEGSFLGEPPLSSHRLAKHCLAAGVHHQIVIVAEQSVYEKNSKLDFCHGIGLINNCIRLCKDRGDKYVDLAKRSARSV